MERQRRPIFRGLQGCKDEIRHHDREKESEKEREERECEFVSGSGDLIAQERGVKKGGEERSERNGEG